MKNNNKKQQLSKDCRNLDSAFFEWLKERLPVYLEEAEVNLETSYFTIKDEKLSQKEVINRMIEALDFITKTEICYRDLEWEDKVDDLLDCWAKVIFDMWW